MQNDVSIIHVSHFTVPSMLDVDKFKFIAKKKGNRLSEKLGLAHVLGVCARMCVGTGGAKLYVLCQQASL